MIYVDTSVILSKLFGEPVKFDWEKLKNRTIFSCSLIYYETISACARENLDLEDANSLLNSIDIISPNSILRKETEKILSVGFLKGADLKHVATAVWLSKGEPKNLHFLSFDKQQSLVAKKLGFKSL